MVRVPPEAVGPLARGVSQSCGRLRLTLGARRCLAFAGDHLQCDVETVPFVTGKPDGARAAAAEWPQGAVAAEHELALDQGWGCIGHRLSRVGRGLGNSFTGLCRVTYGLE